MHCECGADKNPRDVACASCVQLDFWRGKPVLELLHERGPTDVYDIAARLDKNPNTVTKYLRGQEKRGHVEASREDRRTIWRLVA
jgi:predicted ArsR family transcriptional regulator